MKSLLHKLNPQQRKAAITVDGPLLVLSGAGTGKTTTVVNRIAYMIGQGINPEHILAVTFTNKAAREMNERVKKMIGKHAQKMQVSTFHSLGLRILRENYERAGYNKYFTIYDTADQLAVIRKALRSISAAWKKYKPDDVLYTLQRLRKPHDESIDLKYENEFDGELYSTVWKKYRETLKNNNAVDYEDLLVLPLRLFKKYPDILKSYQNIFKYIIVDEYQDTNAVQFEFIKLLANKYKNICAVGDDDQSIYGWRGAEVKNILDFDKHFKNAAVIRLEENYRSTGNILKAANAVISANKNRKPKKLWTRMGDGNRIQLFAAIDEMAEAEFVVSEIIIHQIENKMSFGSYAILLRMNTQARPFEDVLRARNIPYVVVGGMKFYDRKEIRDFLSYLKSLANPDDDEALLRIINVPKRGIGNSTVKLLGEHAAIKNCGLFQAISTIHENSTVKPNTLAELNNFYNMMTDAKEKLKREPIAMVARNLWAEVNYIKELESSFNDPKKIAGRMENIDAMIDSIQYYENREKKSSLNGFLQQVSLNEEDDDEEFKKGKVAIMTVHSAKGLEFRNVFFAGVEQGIIPHNKSLATASGEDEERRLFYVAVTRAKSNLTLCYCKSRTKFGQKIEKIPSMFIDEIPENLLAETDGIDTKIADDDVADDLLNQFSAMFAE
ncbi:MAG: ATP-dependent DNA helicase Rep [Chlamydiae bacterium]|nr:MAG: ATP-dependent DNA helicase Rep [Chlamydiota bacterium]